MKLPKLQNCEKYAGLYVFDFGEHVSVGFTAEEVAELLESERYREGKVYKIHRAYPDGRLELKGVPRERFELEAGMFFYSYELEMAMEDFSRLVESAKRESPPCRAKVQLAKLGEERFVTAIIYPAEYDDEVSSWLLGVGYKTRGEAEGGVGAVERYYASGWEILEREQLFGQWTRASRTGEELLANVKMAVQR